MAARRLSRVLQTQYKRALGEKDHPHLIPFASESNMQEWYFLVVNLPAPFAGGEYIFKLTAPEEFPQKPPGFAFCTQNGVYEPGGAICISIGEFHSNDAAGATGAYGWRPALGMFGFAREVVNGMIDPDYLGNGIRVRNESDALKTRYAANSIKANARDHAELMASFLEFEEAHPGHEVVRLRRMWRAAASAAEFDYANVADPDALAALFADAFGEEMWSKLESSLGYLTEIPDLPAAQLTSMGFPCAAKPIFEQIGDRLVETLTEHELAVRQVLVLTLHARICSAFIADAEWRQKFQDGYAEFLVALPSVCGGASRETVPSVMQKIVDAPHLLAEVHADLAAFLRTENIDEKAQRGRTFCARVRALSVAARATQAGASAAAAPATAPQSTIDDYIDDLFDDA